MTLGLLYMLIVPIIGWATINDALADGDVDDWLARHALSFALAMIITIGLTIPLTVALRSDQPDAKGFRSGLRIARTIGGSIWLAGGLLFLVVAGVCIGLVDGATTA